MSQIGLPDLTPLDSVIKDLTTIIQLLKDDVTLSEKGQPI